MNIALRWFSQSFSTVSLQNVLVICFRVSHRDMAFSRVKEDWIPEIKQHCPEVPYILVGCQTDRREEHENKGCDVVTKAQVMNIFYLAQK